MVFLFAPGAGAPSSHPWMQRWKTYLTQLGHVELLDYPYMLVSSKRPDPLPKLIEAHRAKLNQLRASHPNSSIFLIGKSMGGRVGCHVALEEKVAGVICLGYPLCAMGDRGKLRDQVLLASTTPILFVQGTRDSLCPLDLLAEVRTKMTAPSQLHIVEDGDHSLMARKTVLKQVGKTQADLDDHVLQVIAKFTDKLDS